MIINDSIIIQISSETYKIYSYRADIALRVRVILAKRKLGAVKYDIQIALYTYCKSKEKTRFAHTRITNKEEFE